MSSYVSVVSFFENEELSKSIASKLDVFNEVASIHYFPDGETCVRINPGKVRETVLVVSSLSNPNPVILPLLFLSETLRGYGAKQVILIAPYLAYMRQDRQFLEGQGISARYFARLVSSYFDALITVDPHLHRIKSLDEIYTIPSRIIHAAPVVADWIHENISSPLIIGPDSESEQWVSQLAERACAPYMILEKSRHGDHDVEIHIPDVDSWRENTPVLFDDIISTGKTMIEIIRQLKASVLPAPVCIGVHGIFSGDAYEELIAAGVLQVVTCNTINHKSNAIDITNIIVTAVNQILENPE